MSLDSEREIRYQKLTALQAHGVQIYPERYETNCTVDMLLQTPSDLVDLPTCKQHAAKKYSIAGRIMTWRKHGKLIFAHLQDESGKMQLAFSQDVLSDQYPLLEYLDRGDWIGVLGDMFETNKGEPTLLVLEWTFLGKALLPLPEKWHGVKDTEITYRQRYLDLIMNDETRARFNFRHALIRSLREFYWNEGFVEVETPVLLHSATGANAKPYITHNNGLDIDVFLRISHELPLKELIVGGYEKVFEIGKAFRNEGIDPSHLPEHTHAEHYVAFWNWEDNVRFTEKMFDYLFDTLHLDRKRQIMDKQGDFQDVDFSTPFERVNFIEIVTRDSGLDIMSYTDADTLRTDLKQKNIEFDGMENMGLTTLVDSVYKKVSRPKLINPTIVYNYPHYMQPLARRNDTDSDIVDQFQLVVNGWEVLKAYSELVDPADQKQRFLDQQVARESGDEEAMASDDEYITAMEYGMPPISGWGLGIDRLVALLTKQPNLRDVVLFPLMRPLNTYTRDQAKDLTVGDIGIEREIAWQLLQAHVTQPYLQKHALAVEAVMRSFARHFGHDEAVWGITGLLHDLDYEMTKDSLEQHGVVTDTLLSEQGVHELIRHAIKTHNPLLGSKPTTLLAKTLYSIEELTGLITACALVQPDKKLSSVSVDSVMKKFKQKSFAKGVNRSIVLESEEMLGLPLEESITIALTAMQEISDDLGL